MIISTFDYCFFEQKFIFKNAKLLTTDTISLYYPKINRYIALAFYAIYEKVLL